MEKAVKDGKVRAIGLSNFYPDRFVDMAEYAEIKPAVNQLKTNVFSQQWEAEAEMNLYDTHIMAWAPLAQGNPELLTNPVLTALAERYNKTVQQVALRYLIQRGIIAIPKSTHTERMKQIWMYSTLPSHRKIWKASVRSTNPTTSVGRTVIPNS